VKIPDLISPIIGHRVWRLDANSLKSLNGEPWSPGKALAAGCRAPSFGTALGRAEARDAHDPPQFECTCGVYAARSPEHLRSMGCPRYAIEGEVYLWGTVVEHELGWRAQFAYPKSLFLPPELIPSGAKALEARLGALAAYGMDVFLIVGCGQSIPLCRKRLGFDAAGLDYLIGTSKQYYDRRLQERTLNKGDRVAVLGRGIAVVEHSNDREVHALLWHRIKLRMRRKDIAWNNQNMRWEAEGLAP